MGAFQDLQSAIDDVSAQKDGLDAQYAQQRADIESAYELSETAEERAALDRLLADLDSQRDMAIEQLGQGYDQARQQILERQELATGAGQAELERMASTFESTYARIADAERASGRRGSVAGLPSGGTPDTGLAGVSARANAGLAAAAQARNAVTQEDIGWLADSMLAQREAAVGDASRTAQRVGGQVRADHARAVSDRVNQERMLRADALQNLDARFDQRRDGLLGRHGDLVGQLESMREQRRQFDAQLAQQRAAMAAAAAAQDTAAGIQQDPDVVEDHLAGLARPYTRSGETPLAGAGSIPGFDPRRGTRFYGDRGGLPFVANAGSGADPRSGTRFYEPIPVSRPGDSDVRSRMR